MGKKRSPKSWMTFFVRKLCLFLVTMIGITFLSFCLTYFSPSDPAEMMYQAQGIVPTDEMLAVTRERMGLNRPMLVQYGSWLLDLGRGNMGTSIKSGNPVLQDMLKVLPNTLYLTLLSMGLTAGISIPIGVLCAKFKDGKLDNIVRAVTYLFASLPSFFLALVLMFVFCIVFNLLPVIGTSGPAGIILPAMVLCLTLSSWFTRQVRAIVLRELNNDYVLGLRSRGVPEKRILLLHVLKNSLMPIVTLIGISFGSMLGGSTIVESIFTWPGIGKLAVDSISARDYQIIQGYVVWMALIFLLVNFVVDLSYRWLDPRVRKGAAEVKS